MTMKVSLLISGLLISNIVYADNINIEFKGAITEPACTLTTQSSHQCDFTTNDQTTIKILNQEKKDISREELNNFVMSYQSSKAKIELNQPTTDDNLVNLSIIYK